MWFAPGWTTSSIEQVRLGAARTGAPGSSPALQPGGFARKMRRNGARRRDADRSARPPEDTMRFSKLALLGLCAAVRGAGAAHAQEPVKIRVSWVARVANGASILREKKALARHAGKSYVMEPVRY